eukprot:TRINITY_DN5929_c0_g1_i2.p1 TRINITY_DN5929_c0_g1~~TRINITY_DN5929_c0_g1_i2.p1  ORF type:complete len:167 (-),score=39.39 TRINITY_DN5929_c0_g1_i2:475-975(-)
MRSRCAEDRQAALAEQALLQFHLAPRQSRHVVMSTNRQHIFPRHGAVKDAVAAAKRFVLREDGFHVARDKLLEGAEEACRHLPLEDVSDYMVVPERNEKLNVESAMQLRSQYRSEFNVGNWDIEETWVAEVMVCFTSFFGIVVECAWQEQVEFLAAHPPHMEHCVF